MKVIFETGGENYYNKVSARQLITLEQSEGKNSYFRVTYGLQVDTTLSYSSACKKLGQAILHNAACEGLLNDN